MSIILGIESTAHTFGVAVVRDGKILSNCKRVFTTEKGGMIPMDVAKFHCENKNEIYSEALEKAKITDDKIDAIAFSQGPGLAPCLLEGMRFAKELSKKLNVPIVPVNHCIAHLEIGGIVEAPYGCTPTRRENLLKQAPKHFPRKCLLGATGACDPVMLYVSGANTQIIAYASGKYRIFGETLDLGVGNFIDNFGRYAGIGFPAGPEIEELANEGNIYIELPYKVKGMDIALSGILTNLRQKLGKHKIEDLAYSMQETVFAMLVETAERALAHTGKKELLLGGGVACNKRLQEMCGIMCKERGAKLFVPEKQFLVDNAGMIAYLGEIIFRKTKGIKNLKKIDIKPRQRTDDVNVNWR